MNVWTWILFAVGGGLVSMLLRGPGRNAQRRYEQYYKGGGKMLEDYDAETKEIDKYSR